MALLMTWRVATPGCLTTLSLRDLMTFLASSLTKSVLWVCRPDSWMTWLSLLFSVTKHLFCLPTLQSHTVDPSWLVLLCMYP